MLRRGKHIVVGILLSVFTVYYVNVTCFTHSHIINGVTIVHSHFHTKGHTQTGAHSESEMTLISALSTFQSLEVVLGFAGLGVFYLLQSIVRILLTDKITSQSVAACIYLRAPPSLF